VATRHERPEAHKRNIRLVVEYDGTEFAGYQRQPGHRTVQRVLEKAIAQATGEKATLLASGRTDSGVHAEGQVVNFRTNTHLALERIVGAINARLPEDVSVRSAEDVPLDFHATHDPKWKTYRYRVSMRRMHPVFDRNYVLWVKKRLDVERMRRGAAYFVGTHDFNSFRCENKVDKNTVRTIEAIELVEDGDELDIYYRGNGFLYMMLRIITGTLLRVGFGRTDPDAIPAMLAARDRKAAGPTAPAKGLCLVEVRY
jgi:tRNA pseudouridine38-40 synthase